MTVLLLLIISCFLCKSYSYRDLPCSCDGEENEGDPALKEMTFNIGGGDQTMLVYVQPNVVSFYPPDKPPPSTQQVSMKYEGLAGLIINMSSERLEVLSQDGEVTRTLVEFGVVLSTTVGSIIRQLHRERAWNLCVLTPARSATGSRSVFLFGSRGRYLDTVRQDSHSTLSEQRVLP